MTVQGESAALRRGHDHGQVAGTVFLNFYLVVNILELGEFTFKKLYF